jgi:flagellar L-ring protein precursor FlgH
MNLRTIALIGIGFCPILGWAQTSEQGPLKIGGSLYNSAASDGVIVNRIAYHKGDLLTIVVSESTSGSTSAATSSSKQDATSLSASLPTVTAVSNQFLTGLLKNVANSALGGGTNSTSVNSATAGTGTSTTSTAFSTNITVTITDVKPSGVMTVEGRRTFKMNKQTQTLILQGLVRRDDISINNTVLSQNVADFRLLADGKGLIADRQREGLFTKMLSWLF